ncbi:hypothetical protein BBP40_006613 [Aspergillus hancockii]|nr:hypothetical protein BBP40_006613 [Aspergillus hancockii]
MEWGRCLTTTANSNTFASAPRTITILDRPLSTAANTVWRERRAFAYYFQHAARYLAGGFDVDFWAGLIPQVCRNEPAVWDAINAISTLFESPEQCLDPVFLRRQNTESLAPSQNQKEALIWYSRSLSQTRLQIDRGSADPYVALITCVLYICIESLQGRIEEALQLYKQGVDLILSLRSQISYTVVPATTIALLENTIIPLFVRLGTVALSISGVPANGLFDHLGNSTEYKFTSFASARDAAVPLIAECMLFQRDAQRYLFTVGDNPDLLSQELINKQRTLLAQLAQWRHAYDGFLKTFHHNNSNIPVANTSAAAAALLVYHASAFIIVSTCLTRDQCIYDAYIPSFEVIVEQATLVLDASAGPDGMQPPFTFEMGVGLPLFLTVMSCRDQRLRREALSLLQKSPPVQGFYKCSPGSAIAEKVLQIEEDLSQLEGETASNTDGLNDVVIRGNVQSALDYDSPKEVASTPHSALLGSLRGGLTDEGTKRTPNLIPEKARIAFVGIFRPANGLPPTVTGDEIAKWNRGPDQSFLAFVKQQRDLTSGTWRLVEDYVPISC